MKKIILILMFLLLVSAPVFAVIFVGPFQPQVPNINGSLQMLNTGQYSMLGVYYYTNPTTYPSTVNSAGNISKPSSVQWFDTKDLTLPQPVPAPSVQEKSIKAEMSMSKAQELASKKSTDGTPVYPSVNSALIASVGASVLQSAYMDPATIYTYNGVNFAPGVPNANPYTWSCSVQNNPLIVFTNATTIAHYTKIGSTCRETVYTKVVYYSTVPPSPKPLPDAVASLSDPLLSGSVNPSLQSELDKMFHDPDYVPVFSDSTTGLPYSPPPSDSVASPSEIDNYNKSGASGAATQTAQDSAQNSVDTASTGVNNARNALLSSPSDPALIKGLDDALKGLSDAQANLDKLKAELAKNELDESKNSSITAPEQGDPYGDGKEQDFGGRFNTFMSDMKSSSLFSLPSQLLGSIPAGGQSAFYVDFGRFGNTTFDLASFGSSIALLRTLVLIVFSVTGFYIVALKGGSN